MKNIKRVTILENDQLHEHCQLSSCLDKFIDFYKDIEFTIWEWFAQDVIQNKEASIKRFKELSEDKDHVFLTYPSFIGYDNTFDGWLWYLNRLSEQGVRLKIYVIYGSEDETLDFKCLDYYSDQQGYSKCEENRLELENAIKNHDIFFSTYSETSKTYYKQEDMFGIFKPLLWENISSLIFKVGELVRIKANNKVKKIIHTFYWKNKNGCKVTLIMSTHDHMKNKTANRENYKHDAYQEFSLDEIVKY